jgi:hypothetical protein
MIGKSVEIRIDHSEGGGKSRPNRITGILKGTIRDPDVYLFFIFEKEATPPIEIRVNGQRQLTSHFIVTPKAVGATLERAFEKHDNELPVIIGCVLDPLVLDSDRFEASQTEYFAIGYLGFVRDSSSS